MASSIMALVRLYWSFNFLFTSFSSSTRGCFPSLEGTDFSAFPPFRHRMALLPRPSISSFTSTSSTGFHSI